MNKIKRFLIAATAGAAIAATLALPALAAKPADPDCLGTDVSGFAQAFVPFGQNVVTTNTSSGFDDEVLDHLQGVQFFSSCPDGGFPTP